MAVIGISITVFKLVYIRAVVPYRPVLWAECTLRDIETAPPVGKQVILVCTNATISSSFGRFRAELETPDFRVLVHQHSARCSECEMSRELEVYLESLGLPVPVGPYVIVKNGTHTFAFELDWEHSMRGTVDAIEEALRNPKSRM